jgi:hypothetical protein
MTRSLFSFCFLFVFLKTTCAQSDTSHQSLLAKAGLLHLQKNYKEAIPLFEEAFKQYQPISLDVYKAAGVYSLDSNADKAFEYLEQALSLGWREADWLSFDPYFNFLRSSSPDKWKALEKKAFELEKQYEKTLKHPLLRKQINLMTLNDQRLRYKRVQSKTDSFTRVIDGEIMASDQRNLKAAKTILKNYGWPKLSDIGKDGQNNFWLIVQHSDGDILFQKAALTGMEKLKKSGELNLENYAFLYDRVQCNLNYKQLYGTQVTWTSNGMADGFRAISREDLVDQRRTSVGLSPLKIYALTSGFDYKYVTTEQAVQNDSADRAYCKSQIDSAKYSFERKNYEEVDKYYFNASVILSGMTNKENYEAAVIFAKIAYNLRTQKYKDLSLDFLNLLFLRGALEKSRVLQERVFKMLHKEKRWMAIVNSL